MLKKTVLVRALSIAFSAGALSAAIAPAAMAQSNAAGTIFGKVAAGSATSVAVKNKDTNASRTMTVDANGTFQITALPAGRYDATLMKDSTVLGTATVEVLSGQGVEAVFAASGVQQVQVAGRRSRIDVSNTSNTTTFTARELAQLPMGHNVDAIIQLAPNTTRGDPTYAAGASFGGGGASENAYYINGFVVTNPLTQLGASELPFGAIAQADIMTGGYGAEFGRSVGGVVNITGKSGTNNWEFGAMTSLTPAGLRGKYKDMNFANTGAFPATDGTLRLRRQDNTLETIQSGIYVGGPIIKDKLFMFAAVEETRESSSIVNGSRTSTTLAANGWRDRVTKTERYYGKLNWNITDNHMLELTLLGDTPTVDTKYRSYNYSTRAVGTNVVSSVHEQFGPSSANGAESQILRYTGTLTEDLTLTSLYGESKSKHIYEPTGYNANLFAVSALDPKTQAPGLNYTSPQSFSGSIPFSGATDKVKSFRLDLEYKLGKHLLRAGVDNNKMSSLNAGDGSAGGGTWSYLHSDVVNAPLVVTGGTIPALNGYGALASQGYYTSKVLSSTVSNAYADQSAQYIEDKWQITKDVLLSIGVRNEEFSNSNQDHVKYIEMKHQIAPRFGASWDVYGDASLKVYGSAGRYTVQMPTVVALRGANGSLNTTQYYAYTGTDANGIPTGLTALTNPISANNELGQAKDPKTIAAQDMKPSFQDEITLGFEKAYSADLNFGAKVTYRKLKSTIDDFCDSRPFEKYAEAHNIDDTNLSFSCASFNPGEANTFLVDYAGTHSNYTTVHLSAADLGFPKAERTYAALDLFAEHPYRNGWYAKATYTLSRNKGNTEGQTLSDTVTGQADVAATQTWDYPELMAYSNGLLPNDRKHAIKAYGFYDLTPSWTVGANLLLAAGRPRSCLGSDPNPGDSPNYGSAAHYCGGATSSQNTPSPRGTLGNLAWDKNLDLNVIYKPAIMKGLNLKLDWFNVFNKQTVQKVVERYDVTTQRYNQYGEVLSYTAPVAFKFTIEYNHKF